MLISIIKSNIKSLKSKKVEAKYYSNIKLVIADDGVYTKVQYIAILDGAIAQLRLSMIRR